jgi:hypothetical protein
MHSVERLVPARPCTPFTAPACLLQRTKSGATRKALDGVRCVPRPAPGEDAAASARPTNRPLQQTTRFKFTSACNSSSAIDSRCCSFDTMRGVLSRRSRHLWLPGHIASVLQEPFHYPTLMKAPCSHPVVPCLAPSFSSTPIWA